VVVLAATALAGPSLAGAATFAKPTKATPPGASATVRDSAKDGTVEGIVQSVAAKAIVLRQLDGTLVSIPMPPSAHVFVDGKRASLHDVKPGFVASATWKAGKPATLRAIDPRAAKIKAAHGKSAHSG